MDKCNILCSSIYTPGEYLAERKDDHNGVLTVSVCHPADFSNGNFPLKWDMARDFFIVIKSAQVHRAATAIDGVLTATIEAAKGHLGLAGYLYNFEKETWAKEAGCGEIHVSGCGEIHVSQALSFLPQELSLVFNLTLNTSLSSF